MSLTIELEPETEQLLGEIAAENGLKIETYVKVLIEKNINGKTETAPKRHFQDTATPEEWGAELDKWVDSHKTNTPLLSDEATRRENIYEDGF